MKNLGLFLILLCFFLSQAAHSQVSTGGWRIQSPGANEEIHQVQVLANGNTLITGSIDDNLSLVMLDSNAAELWNAGIDNGSTSAGLGSVITANGDLLTVSELTSTSSLLTMHSASGTLILTKEVSISPASSPVAFGLRGIIELSSGGYAAFGGFATASEAGPCIVLLDDSLNIGTTYKYPLTTFSPPNKPNGFQAITKLASGEFAFITEATGATATHYAYIGVMDASLTVQWINRLGVESPSSLRPLETNNNNLAFTTVDNSSLNNAAFNVYLTDPAGAYINSYTIHSFNDETAPATDVAIDGDNHIIFAGSSNETGLGYGKLTVLQLDNASGFSREYSNSSNSSLAYNADGGFSMVGLNGGDFSLLHIDGNGSIDCALNLKIESTILGQVSTASSTETGVRSILLIDETGIVSNSTAQTISTLISCAFESNQENIFENTFQKASDGTAGNVSAVDIFINNSVAGVQMVGSINSGGAGNSDGYILNLDSKGTLVASDAYGGIGEETILAGTSWSEGTALLMHTDNCTACGNPEASVIINIDENGTPTWQQSYEAFSDLNVNDIESTNGDSLVMVGFTAASTSNQDPIFMILNKVGAIQTQIWLVGTSTSEKLYSVVENAAGNYIVAGFVKPGSNKNGLLMEIDKNGNVIWQKTYDGGYKETLYDVTVLNNGNYCAIGYSQDHLSKSLFVLEVDNLGNEVWSTEIGSNASLPSEALLYGQSIFSNSANELIIGGSLTSNSSNDLFALKFDASRNLEWAYKYGDSGSETNGRLVENPLGTGFYLGGVSDSYNANDYILFKLDSSGLGIDCHYDTLSLEVGSVGITTGNGSLVATPLGATTAASNQIQTVALNEVKELKMTIDLSSTDVSCFGSVDGTLNAVTQNGSAPIAFGWSTGAPGANITNISPGTYTGYATDIYGCFVSDTVVVAEPSTMSAAVDNSDVSCNGGNDGVAWVIANGGVAPYTYNWSNGVLDDTTFNLLPSNYSVNVFDANGCLVSGLISIDEPTALSMLFNITDATCNGTDGTIVVDVSGGSQPYNYVWTGLPSVNDTANNVTQGFYTLTVTDDSICVYSDSIEIGTRVDPVELCVVTVDTLNKNVLNWAKSTVGSILGYNMYRNIAGVYSGIGFRSQDSISYFIDNSFGVDPKITSYRYKIAAVDTCGNESALSDFHETIHLTAGVGIGGEVNLIWDNYEGFPFSYYYILRDSTGTENWEILDSVIPSNFTFADYDVPTIGANYAIEIATPLLCDATKAIGDFNSSRSNRKSGIAGGSTTIEELTEGIQVFPNPFKSSFTVVLPNGFNNWRVTDMTGRLVSQNTNEQLERFEVDASNFNAGTYILEIEFDSGVVRKRLVKQ
jgi:hypothetical protein